MGRRPDVLVVGAGVVGAAAAYGLARAGLAVHIVEAGFPGGGTTSAGMGHIVVTDDSEAQFALTARSRRLLEDEAAALSPAVEYDRCGTLWIARDEAELAAAAARRRFYEEHGVRAELLDAAQVRAAEPNLAEPIAGALFVPDDVVVYPPGLAWWLLDRAVAHGAELRRDCAVRAIDANGADLAGGRIEAGAVVNAAGARAATLTDGLPVMPRKGHLAITDRVPGICRHQLVELGYLASAHTLTGESVAFNLQPRTTGQVLIGSSRELVGWDAAINRDVLGRMLARAVAFVPALAKLPIVRVWTGFRPATPDGLPLIGRWEDGVWVAAGHEGLGITTALATAELLVSLMTGASPPLAAAPFDPLRRGPAVTEPSP